jgi:imidazolonepropionase-like amidohydrolase
VRGKHTRALPRIRESLKTLFEAGVLVVSGSDRPFPGLPPGTASQLEPTLSVEARLKPIDALPTANYQRPKIGREKELGSVEAGKQADLVILDRGPLADFGDIRYIYRVVKGGRLYEPPQILHP